MDSGQVANQSSLHSEFNKVTDGWQFREKANFEQLFNFLLCVEDIIDTMNEIRDADKDIPGIKMISSARRISIQLRKLLLDGNGYLFKTCLADPNFHPLKRPSPRDKPINIVQRFNRSTAELGYADGKKRTLEIPEYEQITTVHPLYGVRHDGGKSFVLKMPFNCDIHPIKFKAWMNTRVLQVDEMIFTAKDLLREVVNKEGAHIEDDKKIALPDGSGITMNNVKNERFRAVSAVKFAGLSYAQYFVFCTGLYIASRCKTLVSQIPSDMNDTVVANICKKIDGGCTRFESDGDMENQTYHMTVLGTDHRVRQESLGDYSTLLKIPVTHE